MSQVAAGHPSVTFPPRLFVWGVGATASEGLARCGFYDEEEGQNSRCGFYEEGRTREVDQSLKRFPKQFDFINKGRFFKTKHSNNQ